MSMNRKRQGTLDKGGDIDAGDITEGILALARGGTGQDLTGKTVAVLEDAQTFTAKQTFSDDIDFDNGIILKNLLSRIFDYNAYGGAPDPFTSSAIGTGGSDNGLTDGEDGGRELTVTASTGADGITLALNDIRNFDPQNCIVYGTFKKTTTGNARNVIGIADDQTIQTNPVVDHAYVDLNDGTNKIRLSTGDGTTQNTVNTDTDADTTFRKYKIVCTATDVKLYFSASGVWTLKATSNSNLPTDDCQPIYKCEATGNNVETTVLKKLTVIPTA